MSQQRTRAGRKGASSGEGQLGSTQENPEAVQNPRQESRPVRALEPSDAGAARGQEQRQSRGSAVHSILNPSSSVQSTYAGGRPQGRARGAIAQIERYESSPGAFRIPSPDYERQSQRRAQPSTSSSSSIQPSAPGQDYLRSTFTPPSSSVDRRIQAVEHPSASLPASASLLSQQPRYGKSASALSGLAQVLEPQPYSSLSQPSGTATTGHPTELASIVRTSPRNLGFHQPGTGSFTLASDVGQLAIGRTTDDPSPSTARGTYRYHTLQTEQGPVSFPLEIQTASRVADEKRRRNAGASARFRARRKEKERASSREIDDLRQDIQDLEEDVDFYRGERDYLAGQLYNTPDSGRYFPRPVSPRRRRTTRPRRLTETISVGSSSREEATTRYQEQGGRAADARHTRRRLSQPPYDEFPEGRPSTRYAPQGPTYQTPTQGHSYGPISGATIQNLPPYQTEAYQSESYPPDRSFYDPRLEYRSRPSPSPPAQPPPQQPTSSVPHPPRRG